MSRDPLGLLGALVRLTVTLVLVSLALHWAAQLLHEAWPVLAIAGGVGLVVWLLVAWLRQRQSRW